MCCRPTSSGAARSHQAPSGVHRLRDQGDPRPIAANALHSAGTLYEGLRVTVVATLPCEPRGHAAPPAPAQPSDPPDARTLGPRVDPSGPAPTPASSVPS